MRIKLVLAALFSAAACHNGASDMAKHVNVNPNYQAMADREHSALVSIDIAGQSCSGFFSSESTITTALHCVHGLEQGAEVAIYSAHPRKEWTFQAVVNSNYRNDTAVLSVAEKSDVVLPIAKDFDPKMPVKVLTWDVQSCGAEQAGGFVRHDCNTVPGDSGAPIMQNGAVVGIHLGASKHEEKNIGSLFTVQDYSGVALDDLEPEWDRRPRFNPIKDLQRERDHMRRQAEQLDRVKSKMARADRRQAECIMIALATTSVGVRCASCLQATIGTPGVAACWVPGARVCIEALGLIAGFVDYCVN